MVAITRRRPVVKTGGKTSTANTKSTVKKTIVRTIDDDEMDLSVPDEPSPVTKTLETASIFLFGESGIGKTELTTKFPDSVHEMFEPGADWISIARTPRQGQFTQWAQYEKAIDNLIGSGKKKTVVHDTADFAWSLATKSLCDDVGVEDINEGKLGFNVGNRKLIEIFRRNILRITGSGRGAIFVSHCRAEPFQNVAGIDSVKLIASMEKKGREFLDGFCDLVICYCYVNNERYLIIRGNDSVFAKCRIPDHFLTPDGEQVYAIPAGESADEAYYNFMQAYHNKQEDPCILRRKAELSTRKKVWKVK